VSESKKKRGGKRANAGRKKRERPPEQIDARGTQGQNRAARIIDQLNEAPKGKYNADSKTWSGDSYEIQRFRQLDDSSQSLDLRKWLYDKADGKAVQTVNHLHDKPIEMNVNVSMAELVRKVRQRKQDYERSRS
jgi:hypothetical protein